MSLHKRTLIAGEGKLKVKTVYFATMEEGTQVHDRNNQKKGKHVYYVT